MNFYNMTSKVVPANGKRIKNEHKRNSSEFKKAYKSSKLKRVSSKPSTCFNDTGFKRNQSQKKQKENKSAGKTSTLQMKKRQKQLIGNKKRTGKLVSKQKERSKKPEKKIEKKASQKILKENKWERIDSLLVKLKNKLEREDPEKLKVFKNIEKILKHVKKKKNGVKEEMKKAKSSRNKIAKEELDKPRLDTLHIDNNKSVKIDHTEENEGLDTKYLFLEHLNKKTLNNKISNLETEDKQNFLTRTLELQSNNNYFFKPKMDDTDNAESMREHSKQLDFEERVDSEAMSDLKELNNINQPIYTTKQDDLQKSQSKKSSQKLIKRKDMEVWKMPSKNSIELISNEIAFRMSQSNLDEHFNGSLRSSSILMRMSKNQSSIYSNEVSEQKPFKNRLHNSNILNVSQSCQDFNHNFTYQEKIDNIMADSIIKFKKRKPFQKKNDTKNDFMLVKSWHELNKEFDLRNKDDISNISNNRGCSTVQENHSDLKYYSESKLNLRKRKRRDDAHVRERTHHNYNLIESHIFDVIFDDFMEDGLFFSQPCFNTLSLLENKQEETNSINIIPYTPKGEGTNKKIDFPSEKSKKEEETAINSDIIIPVIEEEPHSVDPVQTNKDEDISVASSSETIYAIRTHFNAINEYLFILIDFLKRKEKFNITNLINLDDLDPLRTEIILQRTKNTSCFDTKYYTNLEPLILNIEHKDIIFEEIENEIIKSCESFNNMHELIKVQQNFHRVVFDCLMENLVKIIITSLFDINTDVTPCIIRKTNINAKQYFNEEKLIEFLYIAKNKVIEITGFLCGIIRDKEDSMIGEIKFVNDFTLNALREDRMMRMLICEILLTKKNWQDYQLTKKQILLELAHQIEEELVSDLARDFLI